MNGDDVKSQTELRKCLEKLLNAQDISSGVRNEVSTNVSSIVGDEPIKECENVASKPNCIIDKMNYASSCIRDNLEEIRKQIRRL